MDSTIALASFLILAAFSLYALIITRTNKLTTLVLVALIVASGYIAHHSVRYYAGTAITTPPEGNFQLLAVTVSEPDILIIVQEDNKKAPRFFRIPYTKENAKLFANFAEQIEEGNEVVRGNITKDGEDYKFEEIKIIMPSKDGAPGGT